MYEQLVNRWWIVAARGVVSVAFGIAAFVAPDRTLALLVSLFGLFALADGIFTMGAGLAVNWLSLFLEGAVGLAVGLVTLFSPTSFVEMWLVPNIAAYALITGALEFAGGWRLRTESRGAMVAGDWLLGASGAFSLAFGLLLFFGPEFSASTLMALLGGFALVSGFLLIAFSLNVRAWRTVLGTPVGAH
jgi:uncharacterized membrane protein HdeD (DUF308 family)